MANSSTPLRRDYWSPTTGIQSRIAIFTPTDREVPLPPNGVAIVKSNFGTAKIRGYRPTRRDKLIIEAIIAHGRVPSPIYDADGELVGGKFTVNLREVAATIKKRRHMNWVAQRISRIADAKIELTNAKGQLLAFAHMIDQGRRRDGGMFDVIFSAAYLELWSHDVNIYSERLIGMLADVESPIVSMLIERALTQEHYRENLVDAMRYVGALDVASTEQKERFAEVRQSDADFARFGMRRYHNTDGGEILEGHRRNLDDYGLVQIPPRRSLAIAS